MQKYAIFLNEHKDFRYLLFSSIKSHKPTIESKINNRKYIKVNTVTLFDKIVIHCMHSVDITLLIAPRTI